MKRIGRQGLRSESEMLLEVPQVRHQTLGGHSFVAAAPKLWNQLPKELRNTESLQTFKSLLKAHLFAAAFRDESAPEYSLAE